MEKNHLIFSLEIKKVIFCALLGHPAMMDTEVSYAVDDMALITEPNSILIFKSNFILRTNEVYIRSALLLASDNTGFICSECSTNN